MESDWEKYFSDIESQQKCRRRLFRSVLELREIVLAAYRGRNVVLRESLTPLAYETLSQGLEEEKASTTTTTTSSSLQSRNLPPKEAFLREFLKYDWVVGFHDMMSEGELIIPEQISWGQTYRQGDKGEER